MKKVWKWLWYWILDPKGIADKDLMIKTRDQVQGNIVGATKDFRDSKKGAGWRLIDRIKGKKPKKLNRSERRLQDKNSRKKRSK